MEGVDVQSWRVRETAEYLCSRGYRDVTLQFPDNLLEYAARVSVAVQAACAARGHAVQTYILADTTYNPLSVDEVAAAHINAQCVVHYGRASLTKLSRVPAFFVFPEEQLDAAAAAACLAGSDLLARLAACAGGDAGTGQASPAASGDDNEDDGGSSSSTERVLVFLDQPLLHQLGNFQAQLQSLVEARHGPAAAQRLLFPAVPHHHMEPEGQQQQQQQQQESEPQQHGAGPAAGEAQGARSVDAGCCGGGSCDAQQQQKQQQQQPEQQRQEAAAAPCCQSVGACRASTPAAARRSVSSAQAAALASAPKATGEDGSAVYTLAGYQWRLPAGCGMRRCGLAWVGAPDAPALLQLQLTYSGCPWATLDPSKLPPSAPGDGSSGSRSTPGATAGAALSEGLPLDISRALRRRYFLVEKARDACIVGILVGTLGAAGYGAAVAGLRRAAAAAGKKSYTLLMGKPSPAKLANFPEIEVFVLVADPQGQILDSKEYLAPIITPHEAMLAWGEGAAWDEQRYSLGFEAAAAAGAADAAASTQRQRRRRAEPRFSLLAGGYTGGGGSSDSEGEEGGEEEEASAADACGALALHAQQALVVTAAPQGRSDLVQPRSAADYLLHKRSWQGVEAPLVGAARKAVEAAVEGRSGRAAGYVDEPVQDVQAAAAQQQRQQQQE